MANELRKRNEEEAASVHSRRKSLFDWLRAIDTEDTLNAVLSRKQDGTCDWIFSTQAFQDWSNASKQQSSVLWLHGPPGFGKTFLSARLSEHFVHQNLPFATFFCLAEDESRRDPFAVLRSWISDIVVQNNKATHAVYETVYNARRVQEPYATDLDLWRSFQAIGKAVPNLTLLVDGYDECTQVSPRVKYQTDSGRSFFLSELIHNMKTTSVAVVIVSRDRPDISSALESRNCEENEVFRAVHAITPVDNGPDVTLCSQAMIKQRFPRKFSDDTKARLADEAATRSEGMFLWLAMFGKSMKQWDSEEKLRKKLMDMPSELEHIYQDELDRVLRTDRDNNAAEMARSILRWTLFAARPLSIREMIEVMVLPIEGEEPLLAREDVVPDDWNNIDEEYVDTYFKQPCGILIQLQSRNASTPLWGQTIHFPHFSIKEFLLKPRSAGSNTRAERLYLLDDGSENRKLAALCLQYLCLDFVPDLQDQFQQPEQSLRQRLRLQPFLSYSSTYWSQHANTDKGIAPELLPHVQRLFNPNALHWKIWSGVFEAELAGRMTEEDSDSVDDPVDDLVDDSVDDSILSIGETPDGPKGSEDQPDSPSPIYFAAYLGLNDIITDLIAQGADCNSKGGFYGFPLRAATYNGHTDTVKLLLDHGANVNQADDYSQTASHTAALQGHAALLKLLHDHGADLNIFDSSDRQPLHCACQSGSTQTLQAFVDLNVPLEAENEAHPSPLTVAIMFAQDKAVEFLLDHGASPIKTCRFWDDGNSTPLGLAIIYGTNTSIEMLIGKGADVKITCEVDNLMLLTVVQNVPARFFWLHDQGIRADRADDTGCTALHWASQRGNAKIVETLIQEAKLEDINIADVEGRSPLIFASMYDNLEVATLLIQHGADCNFQDRSGGLSPVFTAAYNNAFAVLKYLLHSGADPHKTWSGVTGFDAAVEYGYLEIAKLLLSYGAIRDPEDDQWTETLNIQELALLDRLDEVQKSLSLLRGTAKSLAMTAAVSAAAAGGALQTISWLCEQYVQGCFVGSNGRTALHMAIAGKHYDIAQKLIDAGQDPALPDYFDVLPLHVACTADGAYSKDVILNLLEHGGIIPSGISTVTDVASYQRILGQWDGHYTYVDYEKGREDPTSFTLKPYNSTSVQTDRSTIRPGKVAPWLFWEESTDLAGAFSIYGQMMSDTKVAFVKRYEKHGFIYHATMTEDGKSLKGTWGSSPQRWHGTFEMARIV